MIISKKFIIIFIFVLIVGIVITSLYIRNINSYNNIYHNNIDALKDSVRVTKLSNNDLLFQKKTMILEKADMIKYLNTSKQEINTLEKKLKDKILYISKIKTKIIIDTIYIDSDFEYDSGRMVITFDKVTDFYRIRGFSTVKDSIASTVITDNTISADFEIGLTEGWEMFIKTNNPHIKIGDIKSVLLDPSKYTKTAKVKRFGIGIQAGLGVGIDITSGHGFVGPYIGIGVSWNFIRF